MELVHKIDTLPRCLLMPPHTSTQPWGCKEWIWERRGKQPITGGGCWLPDNNDQKYVNITWTTNTWWIHFITSCVDLHTYHTTLLSTKHHVLLLLLKRRVSNLDQDLFFRAQSLGNTCRFCLETDPFRVRWSIKKSSPFFEFLYLIIWCEEWKTVVELSASHLPWLVAARLLLIWASGIKRAEGASARI